MKLLTYECFDQHFLNLVCVRFDKDLTSQVQLMYFQKFSIYSDETFTQLCSDAFDLDFFPSVNWFKEQYSYLSEKARREAPIVLALPEVQLSEEEILENVRRFQNLVKDLTSCERKKNTETELFDSHGHPIAAFKAWLETQPMIAGSSASDRVSLLRIMAKTDRMQLAYLAATKEEAEW